MAGVQDAQAHHRCHRVGWHRQGRTAEGLHRANPGTSSQGADAESRCRLQSGAGEAAAARKHWRTQPEFASCNPRSGQRSTRQRSRVRAPSSPPHIPQDLHGIRGNQRRCKTTQFCVPFVPFFDRHVVTVPAFTTGEPASFSNAAREHLDKARDEHCDAPPSLPQWRQCNGEHIKAVVEITAKFRDYT